MATTKSASKPASPVDSLKAGSAIRCTVLKTPRAAAKTDTITRLMQMSPETIKTLRKAQKRRSQNMNIYNRGYRDWVAREQCGKYAVVAKGETWTMPFSVQIAPDLKSVESYLKIEKA